MLEKIYNLLTTHFGVKLISIVIAVVLWTVVIGSRTVEITKEIPVSFVQPADLIIANEVPDHISFQLMGPKAFLRAISDRREEPIRINLSGLKPGLITHRFLTEDIHVPIGVKVISIHPASVGVKLEPIKKKDVPVKVELRGIPAEGFQIAKTEVKPSHVRIKGAESKIEGIAEILTKPIDISELEENTTRDVSLELMQRDVQLDGPLPKVTIFIEPTSANYRIRNVEVRILSPHQIIVQEKTVTVFVRTNTKNLRTVNRSQVFAMVDLRGKPKGKYYEPIKVTLPDKMALVKVVPERINIILK
ncbi:MAG: hypothetical protein HY843_06025 [Bdellovibrio sp.]|nr:hypothetical protein [Bdellovibrio sp.]